jgi:hypothetical protein
LLIVLNVVSDTYCDAGDAISRSPMRDEMGSHMEHGRVELYGRELIRCRSISFCPGFENDCRGKSGSRN